MKTEKISTEIWLALWRKTEAYGCIQMEEQPDPCQYVSDIRSFAITAVQFESKPRLLCSAIRQKFEFWAQSLEKSGCIYVPVEKFLEFVTQPGIFLFPIVLAYAQGKCTKWESGYFRQDIKRKMTMIAYHYSVTYQGDKSLQNDFRKNYQRSEPYIRALENGNGVFTAMLLLSMYKDRVLKSEKEGMYEYAKDATEAVFEYIRKTEFLNQVSRVGCIYGTETLENAQQLAKEDWGSDPDEYEKLQILEVKLDPSRTVVLDQNFYNQAYDCMVDYHGESDLHRIMELARDYFSGKRSCEFIAELLSDGENTVLRTMSKL